MSMVALLAEGVDRNLPILAFQVVFCNVALLAEGVDRNKRSKALQKRQNRRPPRGGRG